MGVITRKSGELASFTEFTRFYPSHILRDFIRSTDRVNRHQVESLHSIALTRVYVHNLRRDFEVLRASLAFHVGIITHESGEKSYFRESPSPLGKPSSFPCGSGGGSVRLNPRVKAKLKFRFRCGRIRSAQCVWDLARMRSDMYET